MTKKKIRRDLTRCGIATKIPMPADEDSEAYK
jgi:hypothetical protein